DIFSTGVVLAQMLLAKNIFKGSSPEESRERVLTMSIPDFRTLDKRIDDRLNEILQRALERDIEARYPNADELLYDLEHYIYNKGYGPTNETLGRYIRDLFGQRSNQTAPEPRGNTNLLEHTARIAAR